MTNTETLIASLTAVQPDESITADGDGYIDWSTRDGDRRAFEVGAQGDTAVLWMTHDELVQLHARLTLTLLRDQA
jgi:hypothetical protein